MTTRLPVLLENIRIATPCHADWDEMRGDDRVRFCGRCEKNVYNLSAMPRLEAEALVREKEGRLCVRFFQRADGTVLTADCPVGVRRQRLRQRVWAAVTSMTASAALVLGLVSGRARADVTVPGAKKPVKTQAQPQPAMTGGATVKPPEHLMGKVAPPPEVKGEVAPHLMGSVAPAKPQPKPTPLQGEPAVPLMGAPLPPPHKVEKKSEKKKAEKAARPDVRMGDMAAPDPDEPIGGR